MSYILGFDASTQSLSALIIDLENGGVVSEYSVSFGGDLPQYDHPSGFIPHQDDGEVHANPLMWLDALDLLLSKIDPADLGQVTALSGSGQQHGSVYLNSTFDTVVGNLNADFTLVQQLKASFSRLTSPIWMDNSTSVECQEIASHVGGNEVVSKKSGSVATERFTGAQIRKFSQSYPNEWRGTETIHLVSSFLCSVLAGQSASIDTGDGAGMNLMNLATKSWDEDLLDATADGLLDRLPQITTEHQSVGHIASYFVKKYGFSADCEVIHWSGDNSCSLVGMGASQHGKAVISLGTSDTFFASMPEPKTDPNGYGHVFGNPAGGYMSLICFRNGSLAREAVKNKFQLSWDDFDATALSRTTPGLEGRLMLPFFEDEITPLMKTNGPVFNSEWSEEDQSNAELIVRATLEGQFLNMKAQSLWMGVEFDELLLTGGASQNEGICQIVANIFGCKVSRLETTNSAALGAALMAAKASCSQTLESLEKNFCKKSQLILSDMAAYETYVTLLTKFQNFIQEQQK